MNDNQNYFVQDGRTTSRVLSQPGGQASLVFGGWTPEELKRMEEQRTQRAEPTVAEDRKVRKGEETTKEEPPAVPNVVSAESHDNSAEMTSRRGPVSSNAFASGSNMNSGNVISERPSSRVLAPPGGHCSIRLG